MVRRGSDPTVAANAANILQPQEAAAVKATEVGNAGNTVMARLDILFLSTLQK